MKKQTRGSLFVLSGPSGAGKGTLRKKMFQKVPGISFSISCTTREPRDGEREGIDYHFITAEEFQSRFERGEFLEHAEVHGHFYGTLRDDAVRVLDSGSDILLEIDVQGALQVREKMPESILVFVAPPSFEELEQRLRDRGTESEERLQVRLRNARWEMGKAALYDYVIINDDIERAAGELEGIILEQRQNREAQKDEIL
jgi:guanylate kinase